MVYSAHMGEEWGDYIGVETLIDVLKYGHILFSKFTYELWIFISSFFSKNCLDLIENLIYLLSVFFSRKLQEQTKISKIYQGHLNLLCVSFENVD